MRELTASTTLGNRLQDNLNNKQREQQEEQDKDANRALQNEALYLTWVQKFFDNAKTSFAAEILAGNTDFIVQVGAGVNDHMVETLRPLKGVRINQPGHKYHQVWLDFADWAKQQGLKPRWTAAKNGRFFFPKSWFELSVIPD